jgi:hypothetical protein
MFESTTIQTNQHLIISTTYNTRPKKTGDAIDNNNLTWIEGRNYHTKNMKMTNFFHYNE